MRKLKHHESKLLKKVDFLNWKKEQNIREIKVLRRYHIQNREDYHKYNKLVGMITQLVSQLKKLSPTDPFRVEMTDQLLQKLYQIGLISTEKRLSLAGNVTASSFCRRRLPVLMVRLKMAETVKQAVRLVEHGNVRVGPDTATDPALLVSRNMEDYVTWTDRSKIKRHIQKYSDKVDDYDLLQA